MEKSYPAYEDLSDDKKEVVDAFLARFYVPLEEDDLKEKCDQSTDIGEVLENLREMGFVTEDEGTYTVNMGDQPAEQWNYQRKQQEIYRN